MSKKPKVIAVIPAYNEAGHVGAVVAKTLTLVDEVVVVDDGSRDSTSEEARAAGAYVCRHLVNRGAGGGTVTGLRAALERGADVVVTLDADGQHVSEEVREVIAPILRGEADFVIGSRLLNPGGMPLSRLIANRIADLCAWVLYGVKVQDSQSGFRAYSRAVVMKMDVRTSRFETITELLGEAHRWGFRITAVPITVIYTEYSMSKGQSWRVGLQTLAKLVLRKTS
jgi:UDP-N-acetylglucosamine---dolichyl-phosphate N-acetylglucosaminyltransferase